jgi:membrane fusion protein (multidrug efflux system)
LKKRTKYSLIALALVSITVLSMIFIPILSKEKQDDMQSNRQMGPLMAEGIIVRAIDLDNNIRTVGTIIANEEVEIRSEISKRLTGINFREGTFVSRGRVLFSLDNSDLQAQMNKFRIQEELLLKRIERSDALREKGLLPQEDFDIMQTELETVRADMSLISVQISKTRIRAPFSGIVGLRNVSSGSYVTPGDVLATIQDISMVKIDFSIPERYSSSFSRGQKFTFTVDGLEEEFTAEVYASEPRLDENTRSVMIRGIINNPGGILKPGTFANVTLKLNDIKDAIMIPSQALIPKLTGHEVYIVKEGKAVPFEVELGLRTEDEIQISSPGINQGDTIIMTNILRLRPNAPVRITKVN